MSRITICFFLILLMFSATKAQSLKGSVINTNTIDSINNGPFLKKSAISYTPLNWFNVQLTNTNELPLCTSISPSFYADHLGIMCKEELKLDKITKLPLRIRLGSIDEVDYLEGKDSHR